MAGKGRKRREKNYRAAHGGSTALPPPPKTSQLDALPFKLRQIISFTKHQTGSFSFPFRFLSFTFYFSRSNCISIFSDSPALSKDKKLDHGHAQNVSFIFFLFVIFLFIWF
jgi:hypothetical protein